MVDRGWRDRIGAAARVGGFRTGALVARFTPAPIAEALSSPIGFTANFANRERRALIASHLRRVNPSWSPRRVRAGVQASFDSYARYWIESLRLPSLSAEAVDAGLVEDGYHHIVTGLEAGNGVIVAMPHLGGWEWAGRWLTDRGHPVTAVVEEIDPPEVFEWFRRMRSALGMTVVPLGPAAGQAVLTALGRNEVVCLLSDRDIARGGVEVEFFGERTTLPAGPATLALRTGAPILPTGVYFTDRVGGHFGLVRPPLAVERRGRLRDDVERVTRDLADELEYLIRRAPEQWHLFQPNWPSDPGYGQEESAG